MNFWSTSSGQSCVMKNPWKHSFAKWCERKLINNVKKKNGRENWKIVEYRDDKWWNPLTINVDNALLICTKKKVCDHWKIAYPIHTHNEKKKLRFWYLRTKRHLLAANVHVTYWPYDDDGQYSFLSLNQKNY